jgi:hypothetical protein
MPVSDGSDWISVLETLAGPTLMTSAAQTASDDITRYLEGHLACASSDVIDTGTAGFDLPL